MTVSSSSTNTRRCVAIIPAAGIGSRMALSTPKQYAELNGVTVIEHTLKRLLQTDWIEQIYVGLSADDEWFASLPVAQHPQMSTYSGGDERRDTVLNGLEAMADEVTDDDWVLVHDAARPCLSRDELEALHEAMNHADEGMLLASKVVDTVKRADATHKVLKTVPREGLYRALTPQVFPYGMLSKALREAEQAKITDEASAVEQLGFHPLLIEGKQTNIKITHPEDLALAELYLNYLKEEGQL